MDTHENENGVLSAEDSATYERMEAEIEDSTKAIDRHRKTEEMEKNLNQPGAADWEALCRRPGGAKDRTCFRRIPQGNAECTEKQLPPGFQYPSGGRGCRRRLSGSGKSMTED